MNGLPTAPQILNPLENKRLLMFSLIGFAKSQLLRRKVQLAHQQEQAP